MPTMKAAVVRNFGKPLEIENVPVPEPGPGEVLVKVKACGVCHTDLHAASGDWPVKPVPPFIPGHEVAGIVAALGSGVTNLKVGDAVGVAWLHDASSLVNIARPVGKRCASTSTTPATA
jgi:alcohol dehydrogenase, propanol-preferring